MQDVQKVLKDNFGFGDFRPGQRQVIEQILRGESSVAVFPTGSGKSLCYQLPALILPGLTLVVSPLLALMKDQIDSLAHKGMKAARLDSTMTADEYQQTMLDVRNGQIKLLYVAPERFMNERFRAAMAGISISLFAVDEAHCISEWGHNFRPDYLKLPIFAHALGAKTILALTATATPSVLRDICSAFDVTASHAVVTGFYRPNLTLLSMPVAAADRDRILLEDLRKHTAGPTIIYVTQQKTAEAVAGLLSSSGFSARFYHAGMQSEDRVEAQNWFISSENAIVVATIAFGMGIDKSNIRYVYHYNLPKSLENYSQEIGRAGRDGLPAICKVYASTDDLNTLENFVYGDKASPRALLELVRRVFAAPQLDVSLISLSTELDIKQLVLSTVMTNLELLGLVKAQTPYYQSYEFKLLVSWDLILESVPTDRHVFLNGILGQAEKKIVWNRIDLEAAARALGESRERLVAALNWMGEKQFIELKVAGVRNPYQILQKPSSLEDLAAKLYAQMDEREQKELHRLGQILEWAVLEACQVRYLGRYFGEEGPDCGHCSWCLGDRGRKLLPRKVASREEFERVMGLVPSLCEEARGKAFDAFSIARFLCGISSPVLMRSKLSSRHPQFGALQETPFVDVLKGVESLMT